MKSKYIKFRFSTARWEFWAYIMNHFPRVFGWCDKHLPIDTLPF